MFEAMSQVYNKVAIPLIEKTNDYKKLSDTYLYVFILFNNILFLFLFFFINLINFFNNLMNYLHVY